MAFVFLSCLGSRQAPSDLSWKSEFGISCRNHSVMHCTKVSSERHIASESGPNQITGELELENEVRELITRTGGSPFLFIGSGFSRRYIGLEDWRGLLSKFCENLNDFEYYLASANGKLEKAASLMAADFHKVWWNHEKFSNSRESYKHLAVDVNSALKIEI